MPKDKDGNEIVELEGLEKVLETITSLTTVVSDMQKKLTDMEAEKLANIEKQKEKDLLKKETKDKEDGKEDKKTTKDLTLDSLTTLLDARDTKQVTSILELLDAREAKKELTKLVSTVTDDEKKRLLELGLEPTTMDPLALNGLLTVFRKDTPKKEDKKSFFNNSGQKVEIDTSVAARIASVKKLKEAKKNG